MDGMDEDKALMIEDTAETNSKEVPVNFVEPFVHHPEEPSFEQLDDSLPSPKSNISNSTSNEDNEEFFSEENTGEENSDESATDNNSEEEEEDKEEEGKEIETSLDDNTEKPEENKKRKASSKSKQRKKSRKRKKKDDSNPLHRKNIRKIITDEKLEEETKLAQQEERERMQRIQEAQKRALEQQRTELPVLADIIKQDKKTLDLINAIKSEPTIFHEVVTLSSDEEIIETPAVEQSKIKVAVGSSSTEEEDDDDDVLFVSDHSVDESDDYSNSGSHTCDTYNQPDSLNRVLVNVGHPSEDPDIFLAPQLARTVKPHQIGGIRFLYDNVIESLDRFNTSSGFGCILAHSMGLGKTIQVISFVDILLRHTPAKTVIIVVPINTVQNWVAEFDMWLPSKVPQDIEGDFVNRQFPLHVLNDSHRTIATRAKVVCDWYSEGGVLLIGYEMYRQLMSRKQKRKGRRPMEIRNEDYFNQYFEGLVKALSRPGPDLIICDEGHRIKNSHASISQSLKSIRTRRRVVLTGYPLQNNLMEYWCMVDFVRPNFLGTKSEFSNMFERPIANGQCLDSTPNDVRLMRYRAHVLHSLLEGFVQRRGHLVLQAALPRKEEFVLLIRMTPVQRKLYQAFMSFLDRGNCANPLKAFAVCCKIWNHPDILYDFVVKRDEDYDLELEDLGDGTKKPMPKLSTNTFQKPKVKLPSSPVKDKREEAQISYDWAIDILREHKVGIVESSGKLEIMFLIIEEVLKVGDRILLFSQSLFTLSLIEDFLQRQIVPGYQEKWSRNTNYFRLDGSTTALEREKLINEFNSNPNIHLFLVSTRAGSLGINLIGANRVIVYDASWNPCHDTQAVCRVYRYGQKKSCHVYRLVTDNCMEKRIYDRQINKQGMSDRVVDELNPDLLLSMKDVTVLINPNDMDPAVKDYSPYKDRYQDSVLSCVLEKLGTRLTREPFEHESLLIDRKEKKLSAAEKRLAKRSYEMEKQANIGQARPSYGAYSRQNFNPVIFQGQNNLPFMKSRSGFFANTINKPIANVRPMQSEFHRVINVGNPVNPKPGPNKQDVMMHEIVIPNDINIPTTSVEQGSVFLKAGQNVTVIQTGRGCYLRLQDGKFIAVRMPPQSVFSPLSNFNSPTVRPQLNPLPRTSILKQNRPNIMRNPGSNQQYSVLSGNLPIARPSRPQLNQNDPTKKVDKSCSEFPDQILSALAKKTGISVTRIPDKKVVTEKQPTVSRDQHGLLEIERKLGINKKPDNFKCGALTSIPKSTSVLSIIPKSISATTITPQNKDHDKLDLQKLLSVTPKCEKASSHKRKPMPESAMEYLHNTLNLLPSALDSKTLNPDQNFKPSRKSINMLKTTVHHSVQADSTGNHKESRNDDGFKINYHDSEWSSDNANKFCEDEASISLKVVGADNDSDKSSKNITKPMKYSFENSNALSHRPNIAENSDNGNKSGMNSGIEPAFNIDAFLCAQGKPKPSFNMGKQSVRQMPVEEFPFDISSLDDTTIQFPEITPSVVSTNSSIRSFSDSGYHTDSHQSISSLLSNFESQNCPPYNSSSTSMMNLDSISSLQNISNTPNAAYTTGHKPPNDLSILNPPYSSQSIFSDLPKVSLPTTSQSFEALQSYDYADSKDNTSDKFTNQLPNDAPRQQNTSLPHFNSLVNSNTNYMSANNCPPNVYNLSRDSYSNQDRSYDQLYKVSHFPNVPNPTSSVDRYPSNTFSESYSNFPFSYPNIDQYQHPSHYQNCSTENLICQDNSQWQSYPPHSSHYNPSSGNQST